MLENSISGSDLVVLVISIILFGVGEVGRNALLFLGNDKVLCFCDNQKHQEKDTLERVRVISGSELRQYVIEDTIVVITTAKPKNAVEICRSVSGYELFENIVRDGILADMQHYSRQNSRDSFCYQPEMAHFIPYDKYAKAGTVSSYFWQDLWAAKRSAGIELRFIMIVVHVWMVSSRIY